VLVDAAGPFEQRLSMCCVVGEPNLVGVRADQPQLDAGRGEPIDQFSCTHRGAAGSERRCCIMGGAQIGRGDPQYAPHACLIHQHCRARSRIRDRVTQRRRMPDVRGVDDAQRTW
jgi:hypothetical protein